MRNSHCRINLGHLDAEAEAQQNEDEEREKSSFRIIHLDFKIVKILHFRGKKYFNHIQFKK